MLWTQYAERATFLVTLIWKLVVRRFFRAGGQEKILGGKPSFLGLKEFTCCITLFSKNFKISQNSRILTLSSLQMMNPCEILGCWDHCWALYSILKNPYFTPFWPPKTLNSISTHLGHPRDGSHVPLYTPWDGFSAETKNSVSFSTFLNNSTMVLRP